MILRILSFLGTSAVIAAWITIITFAWVALP